MDHQVSLLVFLLLLGLSQVEWEFAAKEYIRDDTNRPDVAQVVVGSDRLAIFILDARGNLGVEDLRSHIVDRALEFSHLLE